MENGQERGGIQVIERAARVLDAVERAPEGLSLGEIAKEVDLARSTVQRIVSALSGVGFLIAASPNAKVRLGPAILRLAASAEMDISKILHPILVGLSREVGETVDLAMLRGGEMIFIDQVQGMGRLVAVSAVGERFPVHCTANGKAVLALLRETEAAEVLEKCAKIYPGYGKADTRRLYAELAAIRETGLAFDREEHSEGIGAVGTAILDPFGHYLAITIPAPIARFVHNETFLCDALLAARERITQVFNR